MMVWPCESDMLAASFPANAMLEICGSQDRSRVSEDATLDDDGYKERIARSDVLQGRELRQDTDSRLFSALGSGR